MPSWEAVGHAAFAAPFLVLYGLFIGVCVEFIVQSWRGR